MPERDRFGGLTHDRRGHSWIDSDGDDRYRRFVDRQASARGGYRHMLTDDVGHLLPYNMSRQGFEAKLATDRPEVEDLILDGLPSRHGPARTTHDGLRDFADECAGELLSGPVFLEIEYFRAPATGCAEAFRLHFLPSETIWHYRGRPRQYVPRALSDRSHRGLSFVELRAEEVIRIDLPTALRSDVSRAMRAIQLFDELHTRAFDYVSASEPVRGFDFATHRKSLADFARRETSAIGWDGRGLFTDDMLEPYRVWRQLQFARFKLKMLDVITGGFQRALDTIGGKIGFSAELVLDHVLSTEELDEAETAFVKGTRSLAELQEMTFDLTSPKRRAQ